MKTKFVCPLKPWGMGVNVTETGEYLSYGFPETTNPTLFHPDYESCSTEEISNHRNALIAWKKGV